MRRTDEQGDRASAPHRVGPDVREDTSVARVPRRARRALALLALATLASTTTGCYRYVAVPLSDLQPDAPARVQLTAVGVDRIRQMPASASSPLNGFTVSGNFSRVAGDTLVLAVPTTANAADLSARPMTFYQPFSLLVSDVRQVERRLLDRTRTTWMVVSMVALSALAANYALQRGGEATGTVPPPTGPPESILPALVRWSIR